MSFYLGNRSIVNLNHVKNIFFDYSPPSKKWLVGVNFMDGERDTLSIYETEQECQEELDSLFKKMWSGQKMRCPFCKEYIFSDCPEGPEWISIKDRLPKENEKCLAVILSIPGKLYDCMARGYFRDTIYSCRIDKGRFIIQSHGPEINATHWMKLPDLPS